MVCLCVREGNLQALSPHQWNRKGVYLMSHIMRKPVFGVPD